MGVSHIIGPVTDEWHSPDFPAFHRGFHWLILGGGASRTIEEVLRQLSQTSRRHIALAMTTVEVGTGTVAAQLRRLFNAVRRGDGERLARELKAHLEHTEFTARQAPRALLPLSESGGQLPEGCPATPSA